MKKDIRHKNPIKEIVDKISSPIQRFVALEASSGIVLFVSAIAAMIFANSESLSTFYFHFINMPVTFTLADMSLNKTLLLLVNDGLMAIFFFLIGLEIKREILVGELAEPRKAAFSLFAAIGGMAIPAIIYLIMNLNGGSLNGWGIPMATDIAFALGIVTILGNRVPPVIKVFLLSLAIVDDLGAILIIALFYSGDIATEYLGIASLLLFILFIANYSGFRGVFIGILIGFFTWFCFLKSGVHATLAGVLLAFLTPAREVNSDRSLKPGDHLLLDKHIHSLHSYCAFLIMPIFAFFNAGVKIETSGFLSTLSSPVTIGIITGLVIGKPLGIFLFTYLATKLKLCELPQGTSWVQIVGVGFVAGIGFTMSLFISSLAFDDVNIQTSSKVGILIASLIAMIIGFVVLWLSGDKKSKKILI